MARLTNKRGQGLVEYVLVVVLMAIVAIGAIRLLSNSTQRGLTKSARALDQEFNAIGS